MLKELLVPVILRNDPLPVPLVHIHGVEGVHVVVTADGGHVGINALTGFKAIDGKSSPLPFGKGLYDLGRTVHIFHVKLNFALYTV